jgi:hypothetical protein
MPSITHAKELSSAEMKMNNRAEIIHWHAQIIHLFPHEKSPYSFLSVEVQLR